MTIPLLPQEEIRGEKRRRSSVSEPVARGGIKMERVAENKCSIFVTAVEDSRCTPGVWNGGATRGFATPREGKESIKGGVILPADRTHHVSVGGGEM